MSTALEWKKKGSVVDSRNKQGASKRIGEARRSETRGWAQCMHACGEQPGGGGGPPQGGGQKRQDTLGHQSLWRGPHQGPQPRAGGVPIRHPSNRKSSDTSAPRKLAAGARCNLCSTATNSEAGGHRPLLGRALGALALRGRDRTRDSIPRSHERVDESPFERCPSRPSVSRREEEVPAPDRTS